VLRRGLPDGQVSYTTLASDHEAGSHETVDLTSYSPLLIEGTNVLAVEVHQSDLASADLVWDAGLSYTTFVSPSDADGDGLPGDWESANGLSDDDPNDALLDLDGDGQSNAAEFLAGTDPRNGSSFFRIQAAEWSGDGTLLLRWNSVAGRSYRISYSPDLENWFLFGETGEVTATGTVTEFSDPSSPRPTARYYRISIIP
jgi:hypothetical protein